jgi:hypothetical protein
MEPLRELSKAIARHAPAPHGKWKSDLLGLMFGSWSYVPEPSRHVYEPVFALVVQGEKQLVLGDKIFTCGGPGRSPSSRFEQPDVSET